jgi:benzoate 4-monooxygenase
MEIVKTLATLFRLFGVERTNKKATVIREGFFNKAAECNVLLWRRS